MFALLLSLAPLALSAASPSALEVGEEELEAVPAAFSGHLGALPLLPGTSPLLSPLSTGSVRGLQPSATGYFLDGLRLPVSSHLLLGPPLVQDAVIGRLVLERGSPSVERGRLLGGPVELMPRGAPREGLSAEASVDLLRAGALAHWSDHDTTVSVGASALWTPALLTRALSGSPSWDPSRPSLRADLGDYFLRAEHRREALGLRMLAVGAHDSFVTASDTDLLGGRLSWHRADLRLRHPLGEGDAEAAVTFGRDVGVAELGGSVSQQRARVTETLVGTRASWSSLLREWGRVRAGVDVEGRWADLDQLWTLRGPVLEGEPDDPPVVDGVRHPIARAVLAGAFAEAELGHLGATRWTLGGRGDLWHLQGHPTRFTFSPKMRVEGELGRRITAHGGLALVHQPPTFLLPLPAVELAALRFGLQRAVRAEGGLGYRPLPGWTLRADGWADALLRTVELSPLDRDFLQTVKGNAEEVAADRASRGHGYGLELLARRAFSSGWFAWGALGMQRSTREVRYLVRNEFGEPVGEGKALLPTPQDRAVVATAFGGRRMGRWTLSLAGRFHSGALEAGGLSSTTQREGQDRLRPGPRWIEADRPDWERLPAFFRLDGRAAYDFRAGPLELTASLDVQNLTAGREVTGYGYDEHAPTLEAEVQGERELRRTRSGSPVPALPLPMLGLRARY